MVLEAQACGLPVLVTDDGGPQEHMIDGATGYVCSDLRMFARRIGDLAWNPDRRQRLGDAARQYALAHHWNAALEPLYRSYVEIVESKPAAKSIDVQPTVAARSI